MVLVLRSWGEQGRSNSGISAGKWQNKMQKKKNCQIFWGLALFVFIHEFLQNSWIMYKRLTFDPPHHHRPHTKKLSSIHSGSSFNTFLVGRRRRSLTHTMEAKDAEREKTEKIRFKVATDRLCYSNKLSGGILMFIIWEKQGSRTWGWWSHFLKSSITSIIKLVMSASRSRRRGDLLTSATLQAT